MGKQSNREKYLANCAKTFQGQLGFNAETFKECKNFADVVEALKNKKGTISSRLDQAPPEQVGTLAYMQDRGLVEGLAMDALIPVLALRILADLQPKRFIKCRFCEFKVPKYLRRSPGGGGPTTGFALMREHIDSEHPQEAKKVIGHAFGDEDARDEADYQDIDDHIMAKFGPVI